MERESTLSRKKNNGGEERKGRREKSIINDQKQEGAPSYCTGESLNLIWGSIMFRGKRSGQEEKKNR